MKTICYECYETGSVKEKEIDYPAHFSTVKKYDVLYSEELPRFKKTSRNIYALPYYEQPQKIYNGTGRMGLDLADKYKKKLSNEQKLIVKKIFNNASFPNQLMQEESSALQYIELFEEAINFELIWLRNSGLNDEIPDGYDFIGYDVSYPSGYSGSFSIVCDCMFICRWHGCDEAGNFFRSDFEKLNTNGLFDSWQDAYDYMVKYLSEEWTERGVYCILEVYKKAHD